MKTVLLVEDKTYVRENLVSILATYDEFLKILSVKSLMEATDLIGKLHIDAVILGLNLDPAEIDILDYLLEEKSDAKLLVMGNGRSPLAKTYKELKNGIRLEMPLDPNRLLDILSREMEFDYGGKIRGINLASFLQMIQLEAKTGVVTVLSEDKVGELFLDTGNLINAKTGGLNGKEAVLNILKWRNPLISISYQTLAVERKIEDSLMSILLEGSQLNDDDSTGDLNLRRYKRFECAQGVIFHVDDLIYRGVIRDVSMAGLFIETGIPVSIGKDIVLTIENLASMRPDFIAGKVVRSNDAGVGVEFKGLKPGQKDLLKTLLHDPDLTEKV